MPRASSKKSATVAVAVGTAKTSGKGAAATTAVAVAVAVTPAAVVIPVDEHCPLARKAKVVDDWDAMLNQTNIGANNNKYYVIQLIESGGKFYAWTRWGRVGEDGQNAMLGN